MPGSSHEYIGTGQETGNPALRRYEAEMGHAYHDIGLAIEAKADLSQLSRFSRIDRREGRSVFGLWR